MEKCMIRGERAMYGVMFRVKHIIRDHGQVSRTPGQKITSACTKIKTIRFS